MAAPIYLDHHATTPCLPEVVERMIPYFSTIFGNPASIIHAHGREAATALEESRASVARFLGVAPAEVFFTGGATESNNTVIRGLALKGAHVVTTAVEHASVLEPLRRSERAGASITILQPDVEGRIDPASVSAALRPETGLVSVMAANGEIGTIQPISEIAILCRSRGVPFHTDATQAVGKIALDLSSVDFVSFSAHKFYGPKGIGVLVARGSAFLPPLLDGGGQERKLRSGTVNVPGAIGLSAALEIRKREMGEEGNRLTDLRNLLWDRLVEEIPSIFVHGPRGLRLPGNLNISFRGVEAEALILAMRRFSLSSGSACSSGSGEPSHVLKALGVSDDLSMASIRIGMGRSTSSEELELLAADLRETVGRLREMSVTR
jgi:cysteine desulfurase